LLDTRTRSHRPLARARRSAAAKGDVAKQPTLNQIKQQRMSERQIGDASAPPTPAPAAPTPTPTAAAS
jgi:hypothetical protein